MRRFLLAIILFELPLQFDAYLFRDEVIASQGAFSGINISLTTICLALLYAMSLPAIVVRSPLSPAPSLRAAWPLFCYLCVLVVSVFVATNATLSFFEIFLLLQTFLLFVYIIHWARTRDDILFIVTVLMLGMLLQGVLMVAVKAVGHDFGFGTITARIDDDHRVEGTLGSPNDAAAYLTLMLVPALGLLTTPVRRRYKRIAAMALVVGSAAMVLTLSRGGLIAFAVSLALFCALALQRGWLSWKLPAMITVVTAIAIMTNFQALNHRVTGDDDGSASSRLPLFQLAVDMISDHPLIGVGANNCAVVSPQYTNTIQLRNAWIYSVHNKYLLVWVESGALGLAAFLWFLGATLRRGWLAWRFDNRVLSPLALAFTAAMLGQMIHMLVDVFHSRTQVQTFWVVAAVVIAIYNVSRNEYLQAAPEDEADASLVHGDAPHIQSNPYLSLS